MLGKEERIERRNLRLMRIEFESIVVVGEVGKGWMKRIVVAVEVVHELKRYRKRVYWLD